MRTASGLTLGISLPQNFPERRVNIGTLRDYIRRAESIGFDDGWLTLHRSYTGACIYAVRLAQVEGGSEVVEAWANRAPEQYTRTDDDYDARLLRFLVDRLLLGQDAPFPVPEVISQGDRTAAYRHHVVGHERTNDEDGGSSPLD